MPVNSECVEFDIGGSASVNPAEDWYILTIELTEDRFDEIRVESYVNGYFRDENSTYLTHSAEVFSDMAGNLNTMQVRADIAYQPSEYIPDVSRPVLEAFNFSINGTEAYLDALFSENVDLSTLNVTLIEFHNAPHIDNSTEMLALSNGSYDPSRLQRSFRFTLSWQDTNSLKALRNLATSISNTYLIFREGAVEDLFSHPNADNNGTTVQATEVIGDDTSPELEAFSLDMNIGTLVFTFTEAINSATFDSTAFTLLSEQSATAFMVPIEQGDVLNMDDTPYITLQLTDDNLNTIKAVRDLATLMSNTFITAEWFGVQDLTDRNLTVIPPEMALIASTFIPDSNSPELLNFTLDLTSNELILIFNETVSYLPEDVILERIAIHSVSNDTSNAVSLTSSSNVSQPNCTLSVQMDQCTVLVVVSLGRRDLNRLKVNPELATSLDNTYITLTSDAFVDTAAVPNGNEPQTVAAGGFVEDLVSPSLEFWSFDLNRGIITLDFDEVVDVSTLQFTSLTLTNGPNGTVTFQLSNVFSNSTNGAQIRLHILENDLNIIKQNASLFTNESDSFISLEGSFIADMNGQPLNPIRHEPVNRFFEDTTRPSLVSFDLDMNIGILTLEFSETVDYRTVDVTGVGLLSERMPINDNSTYVLTNGTLLSMIDDTVIRIQLTESDLNEIKAHLIGLDNTTTWLYISNATVSDQSGTPVLSSDIIPVNTLLLDRTRPLLRSFILDYQQELLLLSFTETVNGMSVNVTALSLFSLPENESTSYMLSSDSTADMTYDPEIIVRLSRYDLNELKKRLDLATNTSNTFVEFSQYLLADVAGNRVVPIEASDGINASVLVPDIRNPVLNNFTFDLDRGQLILTFSETVLVSSVNFTSFALQQTSTLLNTTITLMLTGGSVTTPDDPVMVIQLTEDDLNDIKLILSLGVDLISTYLTFDPTAVTDTNANPVIPREPINPLPASLYLSDVTSPALRSFSLDLNSGQLILNFTEAVNSSSLEITGITLLSDPVNASSVIPLTGGDVDQIERSVLYINLTEDDLNTIKLFDSGLADDLNSTFISIESGTVLDNNGNPLNSTLAEPVYEIQVDATLPEVVGFDLDMNEGSLILTFTETIYAADVMPDQITLQNGGNQSTTTAFYTLKSAIVTQISETSVNITLTVDDLNEIKRRPLLAIDNSTAFLYFSSSAAQDTSTNPLIPVEQDSAIPVSAYIPDSTKPELQSFDLDLNTGQLTLKFTETVNTTTLDVEKLIFQDAERINATTNYTLTGN